MRVVFLSYSDYKGGASIAARSIYKSLSNKKSIFLTVENKYKESINLFNFLEIIHIFILRVIEKILIKLFSKKQYHQSLNIFNALSYSTIKQFKPDIINLHWINRSIISLSELIKFKELTVISLHDMWFLNSTEHYFNKLNNKDNFLSRYCWKLKKIFLYKKNVFFIAHNKWMFNKFIEFHPQLKNKIFLNKYYPINTNIFKPRNKIWLRKKYNLPVHKKIIFFSAQDISDKRKGYIYFEKIFKKLSGNKNLFFISIGKNKKNLKNYHNYRHINFLPNNDVAEIYSLSDIFVCTSLIDNLPLTILEALSSGNLVFSLDNGGAKEVLKKIGYVFKLSEVNQMIQKIKYIKSHEIKKKSVLARRFALNNLVHKKIRTQYTKIFNTIYRNYVS